MKRRALILATGAGAVLAAAGTNAQSPSPRRIGWLSSGPAENAWSRVGTVAFLAMLKELGYAEGRDFVFESRWANNKVEDLPRLARELLALKPAIVFAESSPVLAVLQKETASVPLLFASIGEPVEQGFITSLSRPGGNITGITWRFELMRKLAELIREALPQAHRVSLLEDERLPVSKRVSMRYGEAASAIGYKLNVVKAKGPDDLVRAFAQVVAMNTQALILPPQFVGVAGQLAELAVKARLPTFGNFREFADSGALVVNYSDRKEAHQRAAVMAVKILKGARPADMPVEEPERMYVIVNQRTARALGIKIPQSVLVRADEVIE